MTTILFFGTSAASAKVLEALAHTQGFSISGVITQPDRPVGRKQLLTPSPVKQMAETLRLPVLCPESLKNFPLETLPNADIFVVYAYGLIIPQILLDQSPHGALNIHPSLLPKYRGPTPVQSALLNGDTETGVSIILLDAQMDHGPIFNQVHFPIAADDTTVTVTEKLTTLAIPALISVINEWAEHKITPTPQDHTQTTICKILTRDDGQIDWQKTNMQIYNLYRGLTPWPGIWTRWQGKRLKLLSIEKNNQKIAAGSVHYHDNELLIGCGEGAIKVLELQLEGKKAMSAAIFCSGYKNFSSSILPS